MKMLAAVLSALLATTAFAQSTEYNGPLRTHSASTTDQIIVKWRGQQPAVMSYQAAQRANKLSAASGVTLQYKRRSTSNLEVFKLSRDMSLDEMQPVLERLNADPDVEYAVADQRRQIQAVPTDPLFANQWYFQSVETAATKTDQAWDVTVGSNTTVVAVLDTGVRFEHPDLGRVATGGKLLPGYDFITKGNVANDNDGASADANRDADPSDPGDWITSADRGQSDFSTCDVGGSSWHGTRVSSLIGALSNEGVGLAGAGWNTLILPVRVLGKCGGFDSDIIDGMRWAAGISVNGVPDNPNPAKILNLSLGGDGACSAAYQAAVTEITARGSLIVASVGNEGTAVGTPANCNGVLGVSGLRHAGTKVGYSSLGAGADIGAPAGNCVNTTITDQTPCVYSIQVATNSGSTVPVASTYTDKVANPNFGTSFSAPLVSGAAALMHAQNPNLTPAQYAGLIKTTSTAFPTSSTTTTAICRRPTTANVQDQECICTTSTCGAGMLNTLAAVTATRATVALPEAATTIGTNVDVAITGVNSLAAPGRSIATYQWSIVDGSVTGATPTIASASQAATTLMVTGSSTFTLRLTVTDDAGTTDSGDVAIITTTSPTSPVQPGPTPIGSGGGGSFDWWLLVLGLLPLALPGPRRRKVMRIRTGRSSASLREPLERDPLQRAELSASTSRSGWRRRR